VGIEGEGERRSKRRIKKGERKCKDTAYFLIGLAAMDRDYYGIGVVDRERLSRICFDDGYCKAMRK